MASGPVLHLGMIFSDLPTCDTFAVGSVGCCSWQGEESWQRGACGPSTVQALSRPKLGTSVSAPEVSHQWFKPCEFQCSNLNFGSWELLRWERKCAFDYEWKEVPEPSSAIWKNKALIWPFCCTLKWDMGRRGGESCPPSFLAAAWVQPIIAVLAEMPLPEPGLGHVQCWPTAFFPCEEPSVARNISWVREETCVVLLCLRGDVGELGWDLTGIQQSPVWPIFGIAQVLSPSQMFFTAWELFSW